MKRFRRWIYRNHNAFWRLASVIMLTLGITALILIGALILSYGSK